MLIFFSDPETEGEAEDAKACVQMALDMQHRMNQLYVKWRNAGTEQPFQARMGINSGYCNVGNFGSADRMDYTIIGAEANLAARLQSIAKAGDIILSYEAYALVSDIVTAHELPPITMKGISREVIPFAVDSLLDRSGSKGDVVIERMKGLDFYLDPSMVDDTEAARIKSILTEAMTALDKRGDKPPGSEDKPPPKPAV